MHKLHKEIEETLRQISDDRCDEGNIVDSGMVTSLRVSDEGHVIVVLSVSPEDGTKLEGLRQRVEQVVSGVDGVSKVSAVLTAEVSEAPAQPPQRSASDPHNMGENPVLDMPVRHIIAVASGKGGVGKSTVSANLAVSLAERGLKVGMLDADIYGPSQPLMMGDEAFKPVVDNDEGKLCPAVCHGVRLMSIGFLADPGKALIWRGPMAQSAFYQMVRDVQWAAAGEMLDVLIIDLPPGTGDVQLTMVKKLRLSGAVIVSTPQDIALIDARRAVGMFDTMDVPVLGLIENMSTYICPKCGHEEHIFGAGGVRAEAEKQGVPYLGHIPLSMDVRVHSDEGVPVVLTKEGSVCAHNINAIVSKLVATLDL